MRLAWSVRETRYRRQRDKDQLSARAGHTGSIRCPSSTRPTTLLSAHPTKNIEPLRVRLSWIAKTPVRADRIGPVAFACDSAWMTYTVEVLFQS